MFGKNKVWPQMLSLFGAGIIAGFVLGWPGVHVVGLVIESGTSARIGME